MNFTVLGKGGESMKASAKMYVQWADAIKEVIEGLGAPKLGKEDYTESSQRYVLI